MNIYITSRKFKAKDTLKNFIKSEIKYLERFSDEILNVDVVLSFTHNKDSIKTSEIKLRLPRKTLLVTKSSEEFSKSVSLGVEKLARQLKQIKSKRKPRVKL